MSSADASAVAYDATSDAYAVQDEDDSKIIELPASRVRRLGLPEDGLDELAKGERVVAIFPETTSFYRAVVSKAPKRGPGGAPSEMSSARPPRSRSHSSLHAATTASSLSSPSWS